MSNQEVTIVFNTGSYKVLYAYTIPDSSNHRGLIKVGDATLHTTKNLDEIIENSIKDGDYLYSSPEIEAAAHRRIKEQVNTAGVSYQLLWSILAVKPTKDNPSKLVSFRDHEVHDILLRNGIRKVKPNEQGTAKEWFKIELETLKNYINYMQTGVKIVDSNDGERVTITLREEQKEAVNFTKSKFKNGSLDAPKSVLWAAIMRFGKTLTSYELIKESKDINRVLIVTHRPAVNQGWFEDHSKIFPNDEYSFGSKKFGEKWKDIKDKEKFVYFVSMQDVRGSFSLTDPDDDSPATIEVTEDFSSNSSSDESTISMDDAVGSNEVTIEELNDGSTVATQVLFQKNSEIFNKEWDLVIYDESHEGTKTALAEQVKENLKSKYWLHLSGTPFNIIEDFDQNNVYTWDYSAERRAHRKFSLDHPDELNPYASLPQLKMFLYDIQENFKNNPSYNGNFDFSKFFSTKRIVSDDGEVKYIFRDKDNVRKILNLISKTGDEDDPRSFPFESYAMKKVFAHTFWMLPTVSSVLAMKELLNNHSYFGDFHIITATGSNYEGDSALENVQKAIGKYDRTITLSVGMLTTGVTIPEWTAVFMLSNMKSPMNYLQTIFRCKSSGTLPDGRVKEFGYVFDFAPDRALEMIANAAEAKLSHTPSEKSNGEAIDLDEEKAEILEELLGDFDVQNAVISGDGAYFKSCDSFALMSRLNRVFVERTLSSGWETPYLYDHSKLTGVAKEVAEKFSKLQKTVGKHKGDSSKRVEINVNPNDRFTEDDRKLLSDAKSKGKATGEVTGTSKSDGELTPEDLELVEARRREEADRRNRRNLINVLNSVSIRIPLLVFAANLRYLSGNRITIDNFTEIVDDKSWEEFMPRGFTKSGRENSWEFVKEFYDKNIFESACDESQRKLKVIFDKPLLERIPFLVEKIYNNLKNPDKETVLTPLSVVNLQYSKTLGGLSWQDDDNKWYASDGDSYTFDEIMDSEELTFEPKWVTRDLEWHNVDGKRIVTKTTDDFWGDPRSTLMDLNSKTSLYLLYALGSFFYKFKADGLGKWLSDGEIIKVILENNIFVNCRVDYSALIASRALTGFDGGLSVNSSVVDVIEVKKHLDLLKFRKEEDRDKIFKYLFDSSRFSEIQDRLELIMCATSREEALDLVRDSEPAGYSAIVGNPPYQIDYISDSGVSVPRDIFYYFQTISMVIAQYTVMIYPSKRWLQESGKDSKAFGRDFLRNKGLRLVEHYEDSKQIFPHVGIQDGVSITFWDKNFDNEGSITLNNNSIKIPKVGEILVLDDGISKILNTVKKKDDSTLSRKFLSQKFYNLESNHLKLNPNSMVPITEKHNFKNPLKIFTIGLKTSPEWFWIDEKDITKNKNTIDNWKIIISSSHPVRDFDWSRMILKPKEIHGRSRISLAQFPTETEALNFYEYTNTVLFKKLFKASPDGLTQIAAHVPDLKDYTNNNPIFKTDEELGEGHEYYGLTLDERLYKLFELSEDEIKIIEDK